MYTAAFAALLGAATGQVTQDPAGVALPYDPATGDNFFALLGETCVDAQGRQMRGRWDNQFAGGRDACRDHCGNSGFYGPNRCTGFDYGGGSTSCFLFGPGMDEPNANGVSFSGDSPSPPSYHGGPVPVRAANPSCNDVANGCRVCWMATPLGDGQPAIIPGCTDPTASNYADDAGSDDGSCFWGPDYPAGTDGADDFFTLLGETCVDAQGRQMRGRWDNQFAGGRDACRDHCGNSGFYGPNRCTGFDYGGGSTSCFLFGPGMDEPNANGVSFSGDSPSPPSYHGGPVPVRAANPSCNDVANGCRVCWMATPPPLTGCTDATADNYNAWAVTDDPSSCLWTDGCMDPVAENYNAAATRDDGSCICPGFKDMQHNRQVCSSNSGDMVSVCTSAISFVLLLAGPDS